MNGCSINQILSPAIACRVNCGLPFITASTSKQTHDSKLICSSPCICYWEVLAASEPPFPLNLLERTGCDGRQTNNYTVNAKHINLALKSTISDVFTHIVLSDTVRPIGFCWVGASYPGCTGTLHRLLRVLGAV